MTERKAPPAFDIQPLFASGLRVSASDISGNGLFVGLDVAAGTVLIRFGGAFFHRDARHTAATHPSTSVGIAENIILAEPSVGAPDLSDFLNHSCDPNCGLRDALTMVAATDIAVGTELTIDYAYWEPDEEWVLRAGCRCGARSCRKVVSGKDWQMPEVAARILRWGSPFLRRRVYSIESR